MGEVGKQISSVLVGADNNVTIVDVSQSALNSAEEMMDVLAWRGHGASIQTLQAIKADKADLIIAATNDDESNILACLQAQKLGTRKAIARVANRAHLPTEEGIYYGIFDIDLVISPEILTAIEITRHVRSVGTLMVENFADNKIELVQLAVDEKSSLINQPLMDIAPELQFGRGIAIAAILRDGAILVPGGADSVMPHDEVFVIGKSENMDEVEKLFGRNRRLTAHRVMLVGGGEIGLGVAKTLEARHLEVTLIERDLMRADNLSEMLNHTTVLNGDGTNLNILEEEGAGACDVFIAVSPDDATNLMAGLLAKRLGCKKVIALVHRPDYSLIYEQLGIDHAISPRVLAAQQILKYVGEGEVVAVTNLPGGGGHILELTAQEGSRIVGKSLIDANIPRGAIIGAVADEKSVYVPSGQDTIRPGNTAIVFTTPKVRPQVERLFRRPFWGLS